MNPSDTASILNFHEKAMLEFGIGTVAALGWNSDASQHARFKKLSQLADFTGKSVIDAGCGHADLLPYLLGLYPGIRYTGIEQLPVLLNIAIARYAHWPGVHFVPSDFSEAALPVADYIIACGSLSYFNSDTRYIFKVIEKLFAHCSLGFGFNLLSAIQYPDPAITFYNPEMIHAFCKTLSHTTKLEQGYWENDFTIFMYH